MRAWARYQVEADGRTLQLLYGLEGLLAIGASLLVLALCLFFSHPPKDQSSHAAAEHRASDDVPSHTGHSDTSTKRSIGSTVAAVTLEDLAHLTGLRPGEPFLRGAARYFRWSLCSLSDGWTAIEEGITAGPQHAAAASSSSTWQRLGPETPGPVPQQLSAAEVRQQVRLMADGLLAKGSSSIVFKACWAAKFGPRTLVAVKVPRDPFMDLPNSLQRFEYEADVLSRCRHPNIIRIYGWCLEMPNVCIITELLPTSLKVMLHGSQEPQHTPSILLGTGARQLPCVSSSQLQQLLSRASSSSTPAAALGRSQPSTTGSTRAQQAPRSGSPQHVGSSTKQGAASFGCNGSGSTWEGLSPAAAAAATGAAAGARASQPVMQVSGMKQGRMSGELSSLSGGMIVTDTMHQGFLMGHTGAGSGPMQHTVLGALEVLQLSAGIAAGLAHLHATPDARSMLASAGSQPLPPTVASGGFALPSLASAGAALVTVASTGAASGSTGSSLAGAAGAGGAAAAAGGARAPGASAALSSGAITAGIGALLPGNITIPSGPVSSTSSGPLCVTEQPAPAVRHGGTRPAGAAAVSSASMAAAATAATATTLSGPATAAVTAPAPAVTGAAAAVADGVGAGVTPLEQGVLLEDWEEEPCSRVLQRVVHRDLKPANILINSKGVAKISGFGLAREHHSTTVYTGPGGAGSLRHLAPELLADHTTFTRITNKIDIYSLGVLLWELATGMTPWANINNVHVVSLVQEGRRPPLPALADSAAAAPGPAAAAHKPSSSSSASRRSSSTSVNLPTHIDIAALPPQSIFRQCPQFSVLIQSCWQAQAQRRPKASVVHAHLLRLLDKCSGQG